MYRGETVAVVVPAYNESGFVGDVLESIPGFVDRIYPVDDDSTDDTWAEIRATAERINERSASGPFDRRVVPIAHEENRGVGGAIKTGYLRARDDRIDVTAVMGGDGQMDPDDLASIVAPVATGRADYAKGDRLVDASHHEDMPPLRYVGNRILTQLTKVASGYWTIEDPQNGYTAISLSALETIDVEGIYEFYGYCNDVLVKLNVAGLRVVDVPVEATYADEESDIEFRTYVPKVSAMLARNACWRAWRTYVVDRHPGGLFAALAGFAGALGVRRTLDRLAGDPRAAPGGLLGIAVTALAAFLTIDREHQSHLASSAESVEEPPASVRTDLAANGDHPEPELAEPDGGTTDPDRPRD